MSLRAQSSAMSGAELEKLFNRRADRVTDRGSLLSSRQPAGPRHAVSTVSFESTFTGDDIGVHLGALRPMIDTVAAAREKHEELTADVVVAATSQQMGFVVYIEPEELSVLGAAGCGLALDIYSDT